jgi:Arc/MetJ family transcription regulator
VAVALHQIGLARSVELNAWSGGGFGMFSTTDAWGRRHLHAWAVRPGMRREIEVPDALRAAARRALALPDERRLRALALALAETELDAEPEAGPLAAIEIQVFATRYDRETLGPSGRPLAGLSVPIEER